MTITEEQWNTESAADIVVAMKNVDTSRPELVGIVGDSGVVEISFDKHLARAVAVRLVELAELLPEPPRILRRASDIDDGLREVDGL
ncbi:hypothetical protein [Microbacterium soli]|uniref:Uncharacterized protein n=1 Tax=Microbacterium soli TaxID=446075 RepID=A0ABP7ND16_9MICO